MSKDLAVAGEQAPAFSMTPRTFDEAMKFAELMAQSDLVPVGYKGKPGNILVAIQKGLEVGLSPMAALETIAVINGRAAIWGDGLLALVQNHPAYEWIDESESNDKEGVCTIKRKGEDAYTQRFSLEDAKRAGLLDKPGTWRQYTRRMLQMRARGFALRDKFSDALKGMISAEEAMDIPVETVSANVTPLPPEATLLDKLKAQADIAGTQPQVPLAELPTPSEKVNKATKKAGKVKNPAEPDKDAAQVTPPHSSAVLDFQAALNDCKTREEAKKLWQDVSTNQTIPEADYKHMGDDYNKAWKNLK